MWRSTARTLKLATGLLVVVLVGASAAALLGLGELHDALHEVKHREEEVRATLTLAVAVRDMYAHQAHTVVLGNRSHLALYARAHGKVQKLLADRRRSAGAGERADTEALQRISDDLDQVFRTRLVPSMDAGDRAAVLEQHGVILDLVTEFQDRADLLAARHEDAIHEFDAHAAVVQHKAFLFTVVLLAVAVLFALGVFVYIGRGVARPLAKLESGARELAKGRLDTRIELHAEDEFGQLADQMNRMSAALKSQQEQLVQTETLAGVGRVAAGIAHEINNPIGVILGYARLLGRSAPASISAELRIIEEEAARCSEIVQELLDLARQKPVGEEPVDLPSLCRDVASRLRQAGQISAEVAVQGEGVARGDAQRLRQLISNLVRNGAEAAGGGATVDVSVEGEGEGLVLHVRDRGPGLDAEARAHLFEPFFTTKPKGTGLGLAVSRAIARAHGGDIQARNCEGGGAVFSVRLPRRVA